MEMLKKTRMGYYRATDVDRLLLKIRIDYEECLREQKQRILELRSENKALSIAVEKYRSDAQYVSKTITGAEQTARKIVEEAELKAMKCMAEAEAKSHQMQMEARNCVKRLIKLKKASESVYMAACRAVPEENRMPDESVRTVAQALLSLYASEQWQETDDDGH